jgi:tetrahydromethanopterin S-methyltransferase subunit E
MPELSPAAQAVFWAFNKAASGEPDDWHYLPAIAASLRSAADQLDHATSAHTLYAFADELEAFAQ